MTNNQERDLFSVAQDWQQAGEHLRARLEPIASAFRDSMHLLIERVREAIPPEGRANILHVLAEQREASERRERWTVQLSSLATALAGPESIPWETLSIFWIRTYGLHDLRLKFLDDPITKAECAARDALDVASEALSNDEWEVIRFLRNNEAHPWADRHATRYRENGSFFSITTHAGVLADVRELSENRRRVLSEHGGEEGFARFVARRLKPFLPSVIAAFRTANGSGGTESAP